MPNIFVRIWNAVWGTEPETGSYDRTCNKTGKLLHPNVEAAEMMLYILDKHKRNSLPIKFMVREMGKLNPEYAKRERFVGCHSRWVNKVAQYCRRDLEKIPGVKAYKPPVAPEQVAEVRVKPKVFKAPKAEETWKAFKDIADKLPSEKPAIKVYDGRGNDIPAEQPKAPKRTFYGITIPPTMEIGNKYLKPYPEGADKEKMYNSASTLVQICQKRYGWKLSMAGSTPEAIIITRKA